MNSTKVTSLVHILRRLTKEAWDNLGTKDHLFYKEEKLKQIKRVLGGFFDVNYYHEGHEPSEILDSIDVPYEQVISLPIKLKFHEYNAHILMASFMIDNCFVVTGVKTFGDKKQLKKELKNKKEKHVDDFPAPNIPWKTLLDISKNQKIKIDIKEYTHMEIMCMTQKERKKRGVKL